MASISVCGKPLFSLLFRFMMTIRYHGTRSVSSILLPLLGGWHCGVKERASIRALIANLRHKGSAVAIVNSVQLVSCHEHPSMSFQILNSISSRWRPILRFRQDKRSRSLGPSIVLVDVVNIDENTINDPWQSRP